MKLHITVVAIALAAVTLGAPAATIAADGGGGPRTSLAGLHHAVRVIRDQLGVPHVYARTEHDVFFMNGYLHAQDRLFQMDASRREPEGTQAELLGPGDGEQVLATDVMYRPLGLRRAAERSVAAFPSWVMARLRAYADGVNAWVARNPLPAEYRQLELSKASVRPWTPVDSVVIFKFITFLLSSSLNSQDPENTELLGAYRDAGQALGFDGTKLFFEDVARSAPFDPTVTIPPGEADGTTTPSRTSGHDGADIRRGQLGAVRRLMRRAAAAGPTAALPGGSNWWLVSGDRSATGSPLFAADPHLFLPSPPVWHEIGLTVTGHEDDDEDENDEDGLNVYGTNFPGVPGAVHGFNDHLMWSSTVNPLDDLDFFNERVVVRDGVPVATLYKGVAEPLTTVPETFRVNRLNGVPDDAVPVAPGARPSGVSVPAATFVVPRLNNGPLLTEPSGPPGEETAIGLASTVFAPTRELEAILRFDRARDLRDFKRAVHYFDAGSQNWGVADVRGNIAYWTGAEAPLREDLERGSVAGLPPSFVRDGTGALPNGWIPDPSPAPDQALPYKILPFDEMPQAINPPQGFIASANNDPIGVTADNDPLNQRRPDGGILYLSSVYESSNRVTRITRLLRAELAGDGSVSRDDMARIQSDTALVDAGALEPFIARAYRAASAPGAPPELASLAADPAVAEAVRRLGAWDFSTPTGIPEGYDAADVSGVRGTPGADEIADSVAATIYSLWRTRVLWNTILATLDRANLLSGPVPSQDKTIAALRQLLDTFPTRRGVGASGLNFFDAPGVALTPEAERDLIMLRSVREALDLAASPAFAAAFGESRNQADYRWGKLHRLTFSHLLGGPFSIPPGAGFIDLAPDLPGISTDGGYETIDFAPHSLLADSPDAFTFGGGPSRRFIGEARPRGIRATHVIAGGESGDPASPWFGNQLGLWLTNEAHPALATARAVAEHAASREVFTPPG